MYAERLADYAVALRSHIAGQEEDRREAAITLELAEAALASDRAALADVGAALGGNDPDLVRAPWTAWPATTRGCRRST